MLDGITLDQFRTFIAAADEGSFSGAGRRLRRAQSVVSQTLANMEGQLGIQLFDRTGRVPVLTGTSAGSARRCRQCRRLQSPGARIGRRPGSGIAGGD